MTHPDPYIEEVMNKFRELMPEIGFEFCQVHLDTALNFITDLYEAQQLATKRQRIKDIEEIGLAATNEFVLLPQNEQVMSDRLFKRFHTILTSRKAAIEEV